MLLPPLALLLSLYFSKVSALSKCALVVNALFAAFYSFTAIVVLDEASISVLVSFVAFTIFCVLNAIKAWKLGRAVPNAFQDTAF